MLYFVYSKISEYVSVCMHGRMCCTCVYCVCGVYIHTCLCAGIGMQAHKSQKRILDAHHLASFRQGLLVA